jgi:hypothetical protein
VIEPLSPQAKAWVRQSAAAGVVTSQVLEHLLERVEALEAAQQQPHQDKLDRLIELDRDDDAPTPETATVATDEELWSLWADRPFKPLSGVASLRAIYNLGRQHGAGPVATLSDALISAEAALSDIAEGEETNAAPNTYEWAEQRCAEALAIIRPAMQQHGIRTSEHLSPAQPAPSTAPAGGLVERVAAAIHPRYPRAFRGEARAATREVAAWLDLVGNKGSAAELRREADR